MKLKNKMSKKKVFLFLLFLLSICITITAFIRVCGTEFKKVENGIWFGGSRIIPYEYTLYRDHVVINKYYGQEQEVEIPNSLWGRPVTVLGKFCFWGSNIVRCRIPKTVVEIEESAFDSCHELIEVTGGEEVKVVSDHAFVECYKLTDVELGTKIERIGDGAFRACGQLKRFVQQDELEYIGRSAFRNSGLEEFEFNSYANVLERAFLNTPWLDGKAEQFLVFGDGSLLYYNGPEGRIFIPDGVKTMLRDSVVGLTDSEIILPQTVQKIEYMCFRDCTNIKIYIPPSVEEMGAANGILAECSQVIIVTTKGSYAEEYAKEREVPCELVESW